LNHYQSSSIQSGAEQIAPNAAEDNTVRIAQQNKF
jgi:hypothetical protein